MINNAFFTDPNSRDRLTREEIPELGDQWIEIKSVLSLADHDRLKASLVQMEIKATTRAESRRLRAAGESPVDTTYNPSTAALLHLAIVDWSFVDNNTGEKVAITLDIIGQMAPSLALELEAEIDKRNPM